MSYATLMVHLELGRSNAALLKMTTELAERFHAGVIGIAACQLQVAYGDGYGYVSGDIYEQAREEIVEELTAAEVEFHAALQGHNASIEWRSSQTYANVAAYVANEARCADLVLTGVGTGEFLDPSRGVDTGDLIMQVGRPVLIVPSACSRLTLDSVLIGWKDTREARRAVSDALPVLKQANEVSVVEIAAENDLTEAGKRVRDVIAWLGRHAIVATGWTRLATGDDASMLNAIGQAKGMDLIVAGAYGHSRLRQWVLGGVTRNLLLGGNRCSLTSH